MHSHYIFVPLIILLGLVFLFFMLRRHRGPASVRGRPDHAEPVELRGEEQRKRRDLG